MKNKKPEEIAMEILRKNMVKATKVLIALLESKDETVRLQAAIVILPDFCQLVWRT